MVPMPGLSEGHFYRALWLRETQAHRDRNDSQEVIYRHQLDPPQESYEAAWRDALQILKDAGPRNAFVLLTASDDGGDVYLTKFAISTGLERIPPAVLYKLVEGWFNEEIET